MIKRIIVAGMLCLFATPTFAQNIAIDFNKNADQEKVSPKVREKMDEFQLKIREIVTEEKAKLDVAISQVDKDLAENKITSSDAQERKQALAENSSEIINEKIQAINFDLDDLIKKQVAFSILNGDEGKIPTTEDLKKKHRATHTLSGFMGYGIMGFSGKENQKLDNHLGFANNFEFGLTYDKQFNSASSWTFKSGLFLSWRTIRLEDNYKFVRNADGDTDLVLNDSELDKSKLRGTYLTLPIGLRYSFGKKVTVEDFTYHKASKFSITGNVYGGVKISNNNIIKGDDIKQRDKKDYNLNPFVYGAQINLGYGSWNVFARKEFSNYFDKNTFDERKMFQVGINYGF